MLLDFILGVCFSHHRQKQQRVRDTAALHVGPLAAGSLAVEVDVEHRTAPVGDILRDEVRSRGCAQCGLKELSAMHHFLIGLILRLRNSIRLSGWHCRPITPEAWALSRTSSTVLPLSEMTKWSPSALTS